MDYLSNENENTYRIISELDKESSEFKQELNDLQQVMQSRSLNLKDGEKREKDFFAKQRLLFTNRNKITEEVEKKNNLI